jgi:hypothetical protein
VAVVCYTADLERGRNECLGHVNGHLPCGRSDGSGVSRDDHRTANHTRWATRHLYLKYIFLPLRTLGRPVRGPAVRRPLTLSGMVDLHWDHIAKVQTHELVDEAFNRAGHLYEPIFYLIRSARRPAFSSSRRLGPNMPR